MDRNKRLVLIRITEESRDKIKYLAGKLGLKQVTVLEYILNGKINRRDLCSKDIVLRKI